MSHPSPSERLAYTRPVRQVFIIRAQVGPTVGSLRDQANCGSARRPYKKMFGAFRARVQFRRFVTELSRHANVEHAATETAGLLKRPAHVMRRALRVGHFDTGVEWAIGSR